MGELLAAGQKVPTVEPSGKGSLRGSKPSLPAGITKKQSHQAQELAKHPEAIAEAVAEAKKFRGV